MLNLLITYRYIILVPISFFEGPMISVAVGFLIHLGYFALAPSYLLLLLGDIIPDTLYYYVGRYGHKKSWLQKFRSRSAFVDNNLPILEKLWHHHSFKTVFLSKLAYGLSTPLLISAGLVKTPAKKFLTYAYSVTVAQYAIFLFIGYYLGQSYTLAEKYLKSAGLLVAIALVIFIVAYWSLQKYARRQIEKMEREEGKSEI